MKIGFDAKRLFLNYTGLGNYSRTLVQNLAEQYPDHSHFLYSPHLKKSIQTNYFLNAPGFVCRNAPKWMPDWFWRSSGIKKQLVEDEINIYHGLSNELPIGLQRSGIKTVVTIHDLIFKSHPEWYTPINRKIYDVKFKYACKHADQIIAISECTKNDIIKYYGIPDSKITVVYQTCSTDFQQLKSEINLNGIREKYKLPTHYLLYVGSIIERKNLLKIAEAISLLPQAYRIPLVIVGTGKSYLEKVKQFIRAKGIGELFIFADHLLQEDLPGVYQAASAFLYPSQYEGFGIPILEALFSRTPVLTSNCSSLPEAAGPGAHLVNPNSAEEIAEGIKRLLSNEEYRSDLIKKGLSHIQQFEPAQSTKAVMSLYEKLL